MADCLNSCSLKETTSPGTVIIETIRTDNDADDLTYSLSDNFENKFEIDSNSGEVKLNGVLDYESDSSYNLEIATDSKGITKKVSSTFDVIDFVIPNRSYNS